MKKIKKLIAILLFLFLIGSFYGYFKPLPQDISYQGQAHAGQIEFLNDLTYMKDGQTVREQVIFDRVFDMIKQAESFIILDLFLFNDDYDRKDQFPPMTKELTEALVAKKISQPEINIIFITDEVNTFYGAYPSTYLEELKQNDIQVVMTDLTKLRDSNPVYSGFWRVALQWLGTSEKGWLPNPLSPDSPEVTLRSYLKLLNFKANHRKVVITEKQALIASANPHDASSHHSNIAFVANGEIVNDFIAAELAVAKFSGLELSAQDFVPAPSVHASDSVQMRLLTEGEIRRSVLQSIGSTAAGEEINIGMFYFSDRKVIRELLAAAERGVTIRLILDPNKDAFGRQKNGIPNRQVAAELTEKAGDNLQIRWYDTHGEQFHTKLVWIKKKENSVIIGGSANLTKRNIGDFNLESDLEITAPNESEVVRNISLYFERIWNNQDGAYTLDADAYYDSSLLKKIIYRFQEWSGMSTF